MHVELLVPGLSDPPSRAASQDAFPAAPRVPALELLCARGRRRDAISGTPEDWLGTAFELEFGALPAGALGAFGAGDPAQGLWCRADPVHLRLMREALALVPVNAFTLAPAEADALRADLNAHFAGTLELVGVRPSAWCARLGGLGAPAGRAPLDLAGADVDRNLPAGADAARWHALMNEAQMLLHDHPVNAAREARGEPPVNSLWPWGGGALPGEARAAWRSVTTDDPSVAGLARLAGIRATASFADAPGWLAATAAEGRHLVQLDALRAPRALGDVDARDAILRALEANWFSPLLAALRAERIGMLTLHLPESGLAFEVARSDLRRFWRRAKPVETRLGA
ncbi:MAG TPA: hypothetical protein VIS77_08535 [Burkholderiales bacterium]